MKSIVYSLVFLLFVGCAHVPSGKYVQLQKGDSVKSLANQYRVPQWKLKINNEDKRWQVGEWIFIPLQKGIIGQGQRAGRSVSSRPGEFIWPVPSSKRVSSKFGKRWGRKHQGLDIAARVGAKIVSVASGTVVYSGNGLGGYGNLTVISHGEGIFSVYAHAKRNFTRKGERVHQGQVIAEVGMTGRTTGPHLHFELRHEGRALNPLNLLAKN